MDFKSWKVKQLKDYLKENGQENYRSLRKPFLIEKCQKVQKGKELLEMDAEICEYCKKISDDCICERCKKCYEVMNECECKPIVKPITEYIKSKPKSKPFLMKLKKVKTVNPIIKKIKKIKPINKPIIDDKTDLTPPLPENKNVMDLTNILSNLTVEPVKQKEEVKDNNSELQSLINLKGYKIKIKLFIIRNINNNPNPGLKNDLIDLIDLILQKYKIHLTQEQKQTFPSIFTILYKETTKTQTKVLKELLSILNN